MSDQARKYSFEDKGYIWSSSNETGFLVWLYWFWNSFRKTNSKKNLFAKINAWPQKQITLKRRAFVFRFFSFKAPDFKYHSNYLIPKTCISTWTHYLSPYTYLSSFPNVTVNDQVYIYTCKVRLKTLRFSCFFQLFHPHAYCSSSIRVPCFLSTLPHHCPTEILSSHSRLQVIPQSCQNHLSHRFHHMTFNRSIITYRTKSTFFSPAFKAFH